MNLYDATAALKKLFEASPIFKAASPAEVDARPKDPIEYESEYNCLCGWDGDGTEDGMCPECGSPLDFPDRVVTEDKQVFKAAGNDEVKKRRGAIIGVGIMSAIMDAMASDTEDNSEKLYNYYTGSTPEIKKAIDHTLMYVCGWSLPTLAEQGHGRVEEAKRGSFKSVDLENKPVEPKKEDDNG